VAKRKVCGLHDRFAAIVRRRVTSALEKANTQSVRADRHWDDDKSLETDTSRLSIQLNAVSRVGDEALNNSGPWYV
jgi:hypothetical protein